jgi:hypothetical protein
MKPGQQRCDPVGRSEMGDAAVGHGDDGVGFVDQRRVEAVAERIAGEAERRAAQGDRWGSGSSHQACILARTENRQF